MKQAIIALAVLGLLVGILFIGTVEAGDHNHNEHQNENNTESNTGQDNNDNGSETESQNKTQSRPTVRGG